MDAPKRIWACENGQWVAEWFNPPLGAQYIRADIAAPVRVKPLVWHKSKTTNWNDDWRTVPTGYTVRCADENGWKWATPLGSFGYASSPNGAKEAAQQDHEARIRWALEPAPDLAELVEAAAAMLDRHVLYCGGPDLPFGGHTDRALFDRLAAALAKIGELTP